MKITNFYYLAYPDCSPLDSLLAESEVYVEVAMLEGDQQLFDFDYIYKLYICTINQLKLHLSRDGFYAKRSLIVVDRFNDDTINSTVSAPHAAELVSSALLVSSLVSETRERHQE